jgi:adenosylcobinamide kinase/adenosylcobinamide-phosphate guanylyltransferase
MSLTLVLGGARSGKSRFAQSRALERARARGERPLYVATSRRWDDDHAARIERHRRDRGPEWDAVEAERRLSALPLGGRSVVVDCVTLWLTNLCADNGWDCEAARAEAEVEIDELAAIDAELILVSNELGMAPHASTEVGRKFVDAQGFLNQFIAARAHEVVLTVAGLPLWVKGSPAR